MGSAAEYLFSPEMKVTLAALILYLCPTQFGPFTEYTGSVT